ncbi:MAG TPA: hypothetical protein VN493_20135 [Thermoanaerobaculia bacterium]|nr:hypothetical protein [Thermoanaerobaculia bacterium]
MADTPGLSCRQVDRGFEPRNVLPAWVFYCGRRDTRLPRAVRDAG